MKKVFVMLLVVVVGFTILFFLYTDRNNRESKENHETNSKEQMGEEMNKEEHTSEPESAPEPDPITELMNDMDLDEKIGQLFISGIDGTEVTEEMAGMIEENKLGGIILFQPNLEEPRQSVRLVNDLKALQNTQDIPLFISVDQEGGRVERLPGIKPLKSAADVGKHDKAFAYENGQLLGRQLKNFGMQLNFAPVLDINSNPNNPVIGDRAYGADASLVSDIGISVMQGMQDEGVITAVKHFPGHGDTRVDSHEALPVVHKTREELEDTEFIPFKKAVNAGVDMVLMAHIKLPELGIDVPASFSKAAVDILREDWDYDGLIITDDLTMGAITDNYLMEEVTVDAVKAGVDILMIAHQKELLEAGVDGLKAAVANGEISEARIDKSVRRVLEIKTAYELNDKPVDSPSIKSLNAEIDELYNGE